MQITDEMVKAAIDAVSDELDWVEALVGGSYDSAEEVMRNALEAALSAQVQDAAGWQPIETAPKDGSSVLGFWSYTYPSDKEPTTGIETIEWYDGKIQGWIDNTGVTQDGVYTHWMPLPSAPSLPEKQED